ncbi:MAG: YigZ family protein [Muribaculaceae bacterium]|nr:YigZ family protein [Muribaculaceae bacterium]
MDLFKTISAPSQGLYKEKMSKFISFAIPVATADEAKAEIKRIANEYHDARHCCWAYMIGTERNVYLSSDNGEPSGTAGKPILGQINSFELTNIVIVVVRYFGGIKLGTSGLIEAYRQAAREAIESAQIIECHEQASFSFTFDYMAMNDVMKIIKAHAVRITEQDFNNTCAMTLQCDADLMPVLRAKLTPHIDATEAAAGE